MSATPVPLATKDNATSTLAASISAVDTSILLKTGDGQLFPQAYSGSASSSGTSTTLNSTGISAAIGGSAAVGKLIWNATDGSVAMITAVSTNSVTTTRLLGGTANTWANSNEWRIDSFTVTAVKITTSVYGVQSDGQREEMLIKARSTDTLTAATRGYNGTTAAAFSVDDTIELRVTSPIIERLKDIVAVIAQQLDTNTTNINNLNIGAPFFATDTGAANAYAITPTPAITAYASGNMFAFYAANANSGASTLNVSGLGTKTIKKMKGGVLSDLGAQDIQANQLVFVMYDGTYFQLLSPIAYPANSNLRYGTGVDGALNVTSGTTSIDCASQSIVIKNYTSINISAGATLNAINVPAAGVLLILLSQGNVTIAGTIDLSGKGSTGGASITKSVSSQSLSQQAGNIATAPVNTAGQTRVGSGAQYSINGGSQANASGGCGGSNSVNAASSTSAAGAASADTAGSSLTAGLAGMAGPAGILCGPGAGGDSGAAIVNILPNYTSGTFTATAGAGGNGGGGLYIACGGNFTFTGTINLSGTNAGSSSATPGVGTNYAVAAGGSGGGAAGTGKVDVAGTITNSGTITVTGGTGTGGAISQTGGGTAIKSDGTNGAGGAFVVCQSY